MSASQPSSQPSLRRSWYSQTFNEDDDETGNHIGNTEHDSGLPDTCHENSRSSDACSEASTDVGTDDEGEHGNRMIDSDAEDGEIMSGCRRRTSVPEMPARPSFPKVTRDQRVDQLKRIVDEFCALDFDAVDASSQEGVARRMLTVLKSLAESLSFFGDVGRSEETGFSLLDVSEEDREIIHDVTCRADQLCDARNFRAAFGTLREAVPRLRSRAQLSAEEAEAMAARRLLKRQRQRQERRDKRASDRAERSALKASGDQRR